MTLLQMQAVPQPQPAPPPLAPQQSQQFQVPAQTAPHSQYSAQQFDTVLDPHVNPSCGRR
jgi:hypothetical protein